MESIDFRRIVALLRYDCLVHGRSFLFIFGIATGIILYFGANEMVPGSVMNLIYTSIMDMVMFVMTSKVVQKKYTTADTASAYVMLPATTLEKGVTILAEYLLTCIVAVAATRFVAFGLAGLVAGPDYMEECFTWHLGEIVSPSIHEVNLLAALFMLLNYLGYILLVLFFRRHGQLKACATIVMAYWIFGNVVLFGTSFIPHRIIGWLDELPIAFWWMAMAVAVAVEFWYFFRRLRTREIR